VIFASIEETKNYLRYDDADNDAIIHSALEDASAFILGYLKTTSYAFGVDSSGLLETDTEGLVQNVPGQVRRATMIMAGIFLRDPQGVEMDKWDSGYPPRPVVNLLYQLRDPAWK